MVDAQYSYIQSMTKKHDTAHSLAVQLLSPVGVPVQPGMLFSRCHRVVKELISVVAQ